MQLQNDTKVALEKFDTIVQDTVLSEYMQLIRQKWELNTQMNTINFTPHINYAPYAFPIPSYMPYWQEGFINPQVCYIQQPPIYADYFKPCPPLKELEESHGVFHQDTDSTVNKNKVLDGVEQISNKIQRAQRKQKTIGGPTEQQKVEKIQKAGGKKWTQQEDNLLTKCYERFDGNWQEVCKKIKGRNASQCFQRWRRMHPDQKQSATFDQATDQQIIDLVRRFGNKWVQIQKFMPHYRPKQIRDRYVNVLDESINKAEFTVEEDELIVNLYQLNGPKWKFIASQLDDRNDNDVKNRFYTQLRKKYFGIENRYQVIYKTN